MGLVEEIEAIWYLGIRNFKWYYQVYDYSRCDYDNIHIIDQDKYLTLSKDILDSLK